MSKNPKIEPICAYCEHARPNRETEDMILCRFQGQKECIGHCFRFRYDPLKRKPSMMPDVVPLNAEEYSTID